MKANPGVELKANFKATLLVLLWTALVLSAAEIAARVYLERSKNPLTITRRILETEREIGWRQKSNLDTTFLGLKLKTDAAGWRIGTKRSVQTKPSVLILGPSSSFGWGVDADDTYSALLEELLNKSRPEKSAINVINAGQIGYSSFQGLKLYEKLVQEKPPYDLVVVAYGVNDLDRHRFYFQSEKTDRNEFESPKSPNAISAMNAVLNSSLLSVLLEFSNHFRGTAVAAKNSIVNYVPLPELRVPVDSFASNLLATIRFAKQSGSKILLLTTTSHLRNEDLKAANLQTAIAASALQRQDFKTGRDLLEKVIQSNPHACDAFYYLSGLAKREGNLNLAAEYYEKAVANEPFRIKNDIREYNDRLRKIAKLESVPVGEIEDWFNRAVSENGKPWESLFVDPIHFSKAGNMVIATEIQKLIDDGELLQSH